MKHIRLAYKNGIVKELYENEIIRMIRRRYSVNQEFAILRQRFTKPHEYEEYNLYVEQCKAEVKVKLGL